MNTQTRRDLRNRCPAFTCGATAPTRQSGRVDGAALALAAILVVVTLIGLSVGIGAL